jgi:hypothetical protein
MHVPNLETDKTGLVMRVLNEPLRILGLQTVERSLTAKCAEDAKNTQREILLCETLRLPLRSLRLKKMQGK